MANSIIVTGASRGIGAAIVRTLRTNGVHVVGIARGEDSLRQLSFEKIGPGRMEYVAGDVADEATLKRAVELATASGNVLVAVVLNAA